MSLSPKQIAGAQKRSLKSIKSKLEKMSAEWADLDEFNANELTTLAEKCEEVSEKLYAE